MRVAPHIERVTVLPPDLLALRADALRENNRLLEILAEDFATGAIRFDQPGEALFTARDHATGPLRGIGGLTHDPYAGAPGIARIRRLYVAPTARRAGLGSALLNAIVDHAAAHFTALRVRSPAAAARFYAANRFVRIDAASATHERTLP